MEKQRTLAYQFTVDTLSANDMIKLAEFRKSITNLNKSTGSKLKVTCHGRGPRIPAACEDWTQQHNVSFRGRIQQFQRELPLKYAQKIDVYLHTRS